MLKIRTLLLLGLWVIILPYLGFPTSWKDVLFTLSGLGILGVSYILYRDTKKQEGEEKVFDNFRENSDFNENGNPEEVQTTILEVEKNIN